MNGAEIYGLQSPDVCSIISYVLSKTSRKCMVICLAKSDGEKQTLIPFTSFIRGLKLFKMLDIEPAPFIALTG